MTGLRQWLYTFPPDELNSILKIISLMPDELWDDWGFDSTDKMVVSVRDRRAVTCLLVGLDESRLFGWDGDPARSDYAVLLRGEQYHIAKAMLDGFTTKVKWHSVIKISILSDAAQEAFDSAYQAVVGVH